MQGLSEGHLLLYPKAGTCQGVQGWEFSSPYQLLLPRNAEDVGVTQGGVSKSSPRWSNSPGDT